MSALTCHRRRQCRCAGFAALALGLSLSTQAVGGDARSRYSSLAAKACVFTPVAEADAGRGSSSLCPGVAGYRVRVEEGDTRVWIAVVAPDGQATQLDFPGVIGSGFSSLGDTAEWRFPAAGARAPQALIVRLNISENPERADVATSYLVIARLGPGKPCITAKVAPGKAQNEAARKAADAAPTAPCLRPNA